MKLDIDNRARAWKAWRVSYIVPKFHKLWSANALNRSIIYPTSLICSVPVHRTSSMHH